MKKCFRGFSVLNFLHCRKAKSNEASSKRQKTQANVDSSSLISTDAEKNDEDSSGVVQTEKPLVVEAEVKIVVLIDITTSF